MRRTILLLVFSPPFTAAKRYLVELRNGTNPDSYDLAENAKTNNDFEFAESDPSPNGDEGNGNDYSGAGGQFI